MSKYETEKKELQSATKLGFATTMKAAGKSDAEITAGLEKLAKVIEVPYARFEKLVLSTTTKQASEVFAS